MVPLSPPRDQTDLKPEKYTDRLLRNGLRWVPLQQPWGGHGMPMKANARSSSCARRRAESGTKVNEIRRE
jgi:hypothetical protein